MVGTVVSWASAAQQPDGERRAWAPLILHGVASALAAGLAGLILGELGGGLRLGASLNATIVASIALAYALMEMRILPLPTPQIHQQVPNAWRWRYPRAVAGIGYGAMLGVGFLTYVRFSTYLVLPVAALLSGNPWIGAALMASYGIARSIPLALTALLGKEDIVIEQVSSLAAAVHVANGMALAFAGGLLATAALVQQ